MATVAMVVRSTRGEARELATATGAALEAEGHRARLWLVDDEGAVSGADGSTEMDFGGVDLAVVLGGDGTFLQTVPAAWAADVPLLGVNFGRLGYLMEVEPPGLAVALQRALAGETEIQERMALLVSVEGELTVDGDRSVSDPGLPRGAAGPWVALNEVVAEKTVPGHTVHLTALIDDEPFLTYSADGVLVATPTGSTAYNLSAGGPALSPSLAALIVTPVAPHLSPESSLVLAPHQVVTIRVGDRRPAVLVVDGRGVGRLGPGSTVTCRVAPRPLRVVTGGAQGFVAVLRSALALGPEP